MKSENSIIVKLTIPSDHHKACDFCAEILEKLKALDYNSDEIFGIHLSLEEALINAVKHGNANQPDKKVMVEYSATDQKFEITIEDQGPGFVPVEVPDPREKNNLYKSSGRGLLLMRAYMDKVEFNEKGNLIRLVKLKTIKKTPA